jgi:hypothetical protein
LDFGAARVSVDRFELFCSNFLSEIELLKKFDETFFEASPSLSSLFDVDVSINDELIDDELFDNVLFEDVLFEDVLFEEVLFEDVLFEDVSLNDEIIENELIDDGLKGNVF